MTAKGQQPAHWSQRIPFRLFGLVLFVAILLSVNLGEVLGTLRTLSAMAVSIAAGCFIGLVVLRCWRWHFLTNTVVGPGLSAIRNLQSCNELIWLGLVTPGRVGEFRRALDLNRMSGHGMAVSGWFVLFDLGLDFAVMALVASGGLVVLIFGCASPAAWLVSGAICVLFGAVLLRGAMLLCFALRLTPRLARLPGLAGFARRIEPSLGPQRMALLLALAAGALLASAGMVGALTSGMGLGLTPLEIVTMVGLVGVSGSLPITYFGLGTRELVLVWYLRLFGLPTNTAIAVSMMFLIAQFIGLAVSFTISVAAWPLSVDAAAISGPRTETRTGDKTSRD